MTRFSIVAEFHPEEALDYANRPYIKMVSSDFYIADDIQVYLYKVDDYNGDDNDEKTTL